LNVHPQNYEKLVKTVARQDLQETITEVVVTNVLSIGCNIAIRAYVPVLAPLYPVMKYMVPLSVGVGALTVLRKILTYLHAHKKTYVRGRQIERGAHVDPARIAFTKDNISPYVKRVTFHDRNIQSKFDKGQVVTGSDFRCTCRKVVYECTGYDTVVAGHVIIGTYYLNTCVINMVYSVIMRLCGKVTKADPKLMDKVINYLDTKLGPVMDERLKAYQMNSSTEDYFKSRNPKKRAFYLDNLTQGKMRPVFEAMTKNDEAKFGTLEDVINSDKPRNICVPNKSMMGWQLPLNHQALNMLSFIFPQFIHAMSSKDMGVYWTEDLIHLAHGFTIGFDSSNHDAHQGVQLFRIDDWFWRKYFDYLAFLANIPYDKQINLREKLFNHRSIIKCRDTKGGLPFMTVGLEGTVNSGMAIETTFGNSLRLIVCNGFMLDQLGLKWNEAYLGEWKGFPRWRHTRNNDIYLSVTGDDSMAKGHNLQHRNLIRDHLYEFFNRDDTADTNGYGMTIKELVFLPLEYTEFASRDTIRTDTREFFVFRTLKAFLSGQYTRKISKKFTALDHRFCMLLCLKSWGLNVPGISDIIKHGFDQLHKAGYTGPITSKQRANVRELYNSYQMSMHVSDVSKCDPWKVRLMWKAKYGINPLVDCSIYFNDELQYMESPLFDAMFQKKVRGKQILKDQPQLGLIEMPRGKKNQRNNNKKRNVQAVVKETQSKNKHTTTVALYKPQNNQRAYKPGVIARARYSPMQYNRFLRLGSGSSKDMADIVASMCDPRNAPAAGLPGFISQATAKQKFFYNHTFQVNTNGNFQILARPEASAYTLQIMNDVSLTTGMIQNVVATNVADLQTKLPSGMAIQTRCTGASLYAYVAGATANTTGYITAAYMPVDIGGQPMIGYSEDATQIQGVKQEYRIQDRVEVIWKPKDFNDLNFNNWPLNANSSTLVISGFGIENGNTGTTNPQVTVKVELVINVEFVVAQSNYLSPTEESSSDMRSLNLINRVMSSNGGRYLVSPPSKENSTWIQRIRNKLSDFTDEASSKMIEVAGNALINGAAGYITGNAPGAAVGAISGALNSFGAIGVPRSHWDELD